MTIECCLLLQRRQLEQRLKRQLMPGVALPPSRSVHSECRRRVFPIC